MKSVFLIGASGYIGGAILRRLLVDGAEVTALSRSEAGDDQIAGTGAEILRGGTGSLALLAEQAGRADAVIYAAVNNPDELAALSVLVKAMEGSGKPLIFTSGATVVSELTHGHYSARQVAEDDDFTPLPISKRLMSEKTVFGGGARGVRTMVVRPPLVYGHAGSVQIPRYAESGFTSGAVRYIGPGENMWAFVHVDDLAEMYARLLVQGRIGQAYHVTAGEVAMGRLAAAIARSIGLPALSCTEDEGVQWYGEWGAFVGHSSNCRPISPVMTAHLGWAPKRNDIFDDVLTGSYRQQWRGA